MVNAINAVASYDPIFTEYNHGEWNACEMQDIFKIEYVTFSRCRPRSNLPQASIMIFGARDTRNVDGVVS
jgi:hypothetical protein